MNSVTAWCGHTVPAVGAPGSAARMQCEELACPECRERGAMTFNQWKAAVDRWLVVLTDAPSEFFPDVDYVGFYGNATPPKEAAEFVIHYAKGN